MAQDGSGNFKTITEAVNGAPQKSGTRYVIYIKAGTYKENVEITSKMTNIMLIGDGKDRTVVTGSRNVQDGTTTFKSAAVDDNFALDTLYYAEYNNKGAGASTVRRVTWKGFHVIIASAAAQFTVSQFIVGDSWISGVPFTAGL